MRKYLKLFTSTLVALLLSLLIATPAFASVYYEKSQTTYLNGVNETGYGSIHFSGYAKGKGIVKSSIKSSNTSVVVPVELDSNSWVYKKLSSGGYNDSGYNDYIQLTLKKAGTAKVKYKAGSKTYTTTVVVKKYVNPVKSLTITGVNGGKNLASKFKTHNSASGKAGKKVGKIVVKAASGWKVTSISYSCTKTNKSWSHNNYGSGTSKATLSIPEKITAGHVYVSLRNTKTGGSINVYYSMS